MPQRTTVDDHTSLLHGAVVGVALVVLLVASVTLGVRLPATASLSVDGAVPDARPDGTTADHAQAAAPTPVPTAPPSTAAPVPTPAAPAPGTSADTTIDADADAGTLVATDGGDGPAPRTVAAAPAPPTPAPTTPIGPGQGDTPRARFASRFPAHDAAGQDLADPASTRWAVLIGINEHTGVRDNYGSRQDAESLYAHLMELGWQADHVLLLTDRLATREAIIESIHWLARKTTEDSVAAFSYAGHAKQWPGQDVDGDGEVTDEGLWPTDSRFVTDRELADLMGAVTAGRMWLNFMGCQAAGLIDAGLVRDGRVVTVSSAEDEKSYEDPSVGHSVWGWNLTVQGLRHGLADANEDGEVTVQEAATFAIPRAARRTQNQRPHGPQNGEMVDHSGGALSLAVPAPPPPPEPQPAAEESPDPSSSPRSCLLGLCRRGD